MLSMQLTLWRCLLLLAVLASLLYISPTNAVGSPHATSGQTDPEWAAIDQFVEAEMQAMRLPGLVLGIVYNERIVYLKGFGKADPSGTPVTPQTPFLIASLTKSFTAMAIMQLVEAGKVDLDTPVQHYIPWFRVADEVSSARITVHQLLTHTSGLPTLTGHEDMVFNRHLSEDVLEQRVRALHTTRVTAPPGTRFQYSNAGYATLAVIVQHVSGQSYERYLQQHVYDPLEMRRSFVSQQDARRRGLATGYRYWFGWPVAHDWSYSYAEMGAGFTISTAEDLTHYLVAQLNGGNYRNRRVLSPGGIAAMHQPAARIELGGPHSINESYGMGWFVRETNGVRMVMHAGASPNFHADLVLVPEGKWGIVLLMNGENSLDPARISRISSGVTGLLVGEELPGTVSSNDFKPTLLVLVLVVSAFQVLGMMRTAVVLRRWRRQPEHRPRSWLWIGLHLVLPFVLNLMWSLLCLVGLPRFFVWPWWYLLHFVPDLGYALVLSGSTALGWSVLKPALVLLTLRIQDEPSAIVVPSPA